MSNNLKMRLLHIPFVGKTLFYKLFVKKEGGELRSQSLRELVERNNKVKIGVYTYGGCFQPGRIIKYRFTEDIQKLIEESKWWEKTPEELCQYYQFMNNSEVFCKVICKSEK